MQVEIETVDDHSFQQISSPADLSKAEAKLNKVVGKADGRIVRTDESQGLLSDQPLTWGPILLFGAIASFLSVGFARQHFSGDRPEAFLSIWQKKAEQR